MPNKVGKINEIHVIVFPYPIQGHINPMLQFSKQLVSRDLKVTLATTSAFSSKFTPSQQLQSSSITVNHISDGSDDVNETANTKNANTYIDRFEVIAPQSLTQLIENKIRLGHNLKCLIYDSTIPWALDIARKFGLYGASYFTQSCLVSSIFYQVYEGILSAPVDGPGVSISGMPIIESRDLPSLVREVGVFPSLEKLVLKQFSNYGEADSRFFNTIDVLEYEVRPYVCNS